MNTATESQLNALRARKKVRSTTWWAAGAAVFFVVATGCMVLLPPPGTLLSTGLTVLLGCFTIALGVVKQTMSVREREFRAEIAGLTPDAFNREAIASLRAAERSAGDWATGSGLYIWVFGLGTVFAAWLK